jgi:hypothetical protein
MYSAEAKQTYIELYETVTEKLASVYLAPLAEVQESQTEEQSNETTS